MKWVAEYRGNDQVWRVVSKAPRGSAERAKQECKGFLSQSEDKVIDFRIVSYDIERVPYHYSIAPHKPRMKWVWVASYSRTRKA